MPLRMFFTLLLSLTLTTTIYAQSTPGHGGHGGGSGGGSDDASCIKAKISHFKPEHLAVVSPESDFSFTVSGSNGPAHIHVSIRQEVVPIIVEDKEMFYLVKGSFPAKYQNDTIRLSVKVNAKAKHCDAENGILVKIAQ